MKNKLRELCHPCQRAGRNHVNARRTNWTMLANKIQTNPTTLAYGLNSSTNGNGLLFSIHFEQKSRIRIHCSMELDRTMISKRFSQSSCVDAFCIPLMNPVFELCLCHLLLCDVFDRTYGKIHKKSFISHTGDTPLLIQPHFFGGLSIGALPAPRQAHFVAQARNWHVQCLTVDLVGLDGLVGFILSDFRKTAGEGQKKERKRENCRNMLYLF